jgi:Transmembrane secretion effector
MAVNAFAQRAWKPLEASMFRRILVASFVADLGSFMQSVGAAWLMVSMQAGPFFVALTQTASTLPFFLLGLPAGSRIEHRLPARSARAGERRHHRRRAQRVVYANIGHSVVSDDGGHFYAGGGFKVVIGR